MNMTREWQLLWGRSYCPFV